MRYAKSFALTMLILLAVMLVFVFANWVIVHLTWILPVALVCVVFAWFWWVVHGIIEGS